FEATFEPRIDDVAAHFDLPLAADRQGTDLEQRGTQLLAVSRILDQALGRIGVQPDLLAGHSVGEWCAMVASGIVPPDQVDAFLDALGPGSLDVPDVAFLAVGCGAEDAAALVGDEVDISHDNCPHQSILCGRDEAIEDARQRLVSEGILCQSLPFRSGFHSPSFEPYLSGPRRHLEGLPLATPHTAMWSATTCAPYPDAPDAVRDLVVDHLTKPVRFRQLTDALYAQAIRAFVQVGPGSLTGFINDTLRDQPHLTVSANDPKRSGLEQLRRVAAALWCEGYPVEVDQLPGHVEHARPSRARPLKLGAPLVSLPPELALRTPPRVDATVDVEGLSPAVAAELQQTTQAFVEAQAQIAEALRQRNAASGPAQQDAGLGPRQRTTTATFSLDAFPFLIDHCFYRQPDGWPDARDRFPVVPMTMQLDRMLREAQALVPELTPVAIESVRAFRWCAVAPPVEVEIRSTFDGTDQVHVRIGDYAVGTVRLAATYPSAPPPTGQALADAEPLPIDAADVYRDRWMFHGPAYHGLARLDEVSASGITGLLKTREATGALLDNAGQLMGFWIMWRKERDRLAFPTRIDRLAFYGPHPAPGEHLECR
ncbi:MAG: acyltransferase domain-containing protein, partial [Bacteroidota bacterium]